MIHFPPLRTRRLTVQLRELSIGESIAIAAMPAHLEEASCTAFLRAAVQSVQGIPDPANWTVQERIFAICHYLACTADDGPDFALGEGHYSDYLDGAADIQTPQIEVGEIGGDTWNVRHLTGCMAESIERLQGEILNALGQPLPSRLHWILGAMAAQMVRTGENLPDAMTEGAFDEWLVARMRVMAAFPESDFAALRALFTVGCEKLYHLFHIEFSADGIVAMPKEAAADSLPPARFPVYACLAPMAFEFIDRPDDAGE